AHRLAGLLEAGAVALQGDGQERSMGFEMLEDGGGKPAQLLTKGLTLRRCQRGVELFRQLLAAAFDQLFEQCIPVLEMVVDGANRDAGAGGDLLHPRLAQTTRGEDLLGRGGDGARSLGAEPIPQSWFSF